MAYAERPIETFDVQIPAEDVVLRGDLTIPRAARGLVLFAHGSGSSRFSPRNRRVAGFLVRNGLATLLLDLLTEEEERREAPTGGLRFNVDLLSRRLAAATEWAASETGLFHLPIGYFGASTGAAAALIAASDLSRRVKAVVSRGGRPDLAGPALTEVQVPTLLIVGGSDPEVLELNRSALRRLRCVKRLAVVPGATHLFEEPGALDEVARLSAEWFREHLWASLEFGDAKPAIGAPGRMR